MSSPSANEKQHYTLNADKVRWVSDFHTINAINRAREISHFRHQVKI